MLGALWLKGRRRSRKGIIKFKIPEGLGLWEKRWWPWASWGYLPSSLGRFWAGVSLWFSARNGDKVLSMQNLLKAKFGVIKRNMPPPETLSRTKPGLKMFKGFMESLNYR